MNHRLEYGDGCSCSMCCSTTAVITSVSYPTAWSNSNNVDMTGYGSIWSCIYPPIVFQSARSYALFEFGTGVAVWLEAPL